MREGCHFQGVVRGTFGELKTHNIKLLQLSVQNKDRNVGFPFLKTCLFPVRH